MIHDTLDALCRLLDLETMTPASVAAVLGTELVEQPTTRRARRFVAASGSPPFQAAALVLEENDEQRTELRLEPASAPHRSEVVAALGPGHAISVDPSVPPHGRVTIEYPLDRHAVYLSFDGVDGALLRVVVQLGGRPS